MIGFLIWELGGVIFLGLGIYDWHAKSTAPFGFWANAEVVQVEDVKAYNKALGKLFCVFGAVFMLLGIPLLGGQNTAGALISILGAMFEAIAAMAVYTTKIEGKYRKK